MLKEKKVFVQSGMNLDTDARSLPPNHYGFALNVLTNNSNGSNLGAIENRKGNTIISFSLPDGVNRVCGATKDIQRSAIVYFIQNSLKNHCILRYNIKTKTIDKIAYAEPILNFQPDIIISSINIVGDLLYWTDGYFNKFTYDPALGELKDQYFNPPRKLNMVKAYNYTNNVAVNPLYKYSDITEEILDRIKYVYKDKPICSYNTDPNKSFNYLVGHLFQFAVIYIYDDNEHSTISAISDVPIPVNQEYPDGTYSSLFPSLNNVIDILFDSGSEIVTKIKLIVREGNIGDWYEFDTIEKYSPDGSIIVQSGVQYQYTVGNGVGFYNNRMLIAQDQLNIARLFSYVGQIVDSQSIISDNRLIDGGIVENYDNCIIDVDLSYEYKKIDFSGSTMVYPVSITQPISGNIYPAWSGFQITMYFPATANVGDLFQFYLNVTPDIGDQKIYTFNYVYKSTDTYPDDIIISIYNYLLNAFPQWSNISYDLSARTITMWLCHFLFEEPSDVVHDMEQFADVIIISNLSIVKKVPIINGFKEGFSHNFGLVYFDRAGRTGAVNTSKESEKYVKFITETEFAGDLTSIKRVPVFNWQINHRPPEWAEYAQWYYIHQTPVFLQYCYTYAHIVGQNIQIKIDEPINLLRTTKPKSNISNYKYSKGDRIRFISHGNNLTPSQWKYFDEYIDTEITGFDTTSGEIIIDDIGFTSKQIDLVSAGYDFNVIEIYSPKKITDETAYYAIDDIIRIDKPHTDDRAHVGKNGIVQDFNATIVNVPIIRIDLFQWAPGGQHNYGFVIDYPYPLTVNPSSILPGETIEISGLTDPASVFLNGNHVVMLTTIAGSELRIVVNDGAMFPSYYPPVYYSFLNAAGGNLVHHSIPTPASGLFNFGDVYIRGRYTVTPTLIPVESLSLSDYYNSDIISIGNLSTVIPDIKRQKYRKLRYSGQLLEDTLINNLSRFDMLNQEEIGNEYGDISAIRQIGDTLKVLQQNKNTSFYIGVQMMTSADGSQIPIQSSGVVFSKPNPSPLGYGCQNPESVMVNDRYMYFYDQNYGVFIRDAANGMTIVSDNGMKSFFTRKRQEINDSYKHKVITSFNKKFNEVVVTFITTNLVVDPRDSSVMVEEVLSETVCFCENSDTWTSFLSYSKYIGLTDTPIDYMANNGETFVTFLNGQLYLENEGVFGNFFGEQKDMVVDVISNIEQEKVKIFSAIGLTTNHNKTSLPDSWYVDSIIVPTTDVNAAGQLSEIAASGFRMKEEVLYADVPRDINSPMTGSNKFKLINGRVMRGQCATFRLKNNSNDAVVLYSVIFKTIPSEQSK